MAVADLFRNECLAVLDIQPVYCLCHLPTTDIVYFSVFFGSIDGIDTEGPVVDIELNGIFMLVGCVFSDVVASHDNLHYACLNVVRLCHTCTSAIAFKLKKRSVINGVDGCNTVSDGQ